MNLGLSRKPLVTGMHHRGTVANLVEVRRENGLERAAIGVIMPGVQTRTAARGARETPPAADAASQAG